MEASGDAGRMARAGAGILGRVLDNLVPPSSGQRFPALDGLRGLAALAVVLHHAPIVSLLPGAQLGTTAVCVFFALSAFLLYSPWVRGKAPAISDYYRRRAFRMYPAYLVALGFAVVVRSAIGRPAAAYDVLSHLAFVQSFFPAYSESMIRAAWSLGAEVQFYLALPLLALAIARRKTALLVAGIAAVALVQWGLPRESQGWQNWPALGLPFFFGMLAAEAAARWPGRCRAVGVPGLVMALALREFMLIGPGAALAADGGLWHMLLNGRGLFSSAAVACAIAGLAVAEKGACYRFFASRPVRSLGVCGYGIFLFHMPLFAVLTHWWGKPASLMVGLPVTLAVSVASYLYIEAPAMRYASRRKPSLRVSESVRL